MTQVLDSVDKSSPDSSSGKVEQQDTQACCSELLPTVCTPVSEDCVARADAGKEAWFFLSACWAVQFLIYGMCFRQPFLITSRAHQRENQGLASLLGYSEITMAHTSLLRSRAISP